jgi:Lipid A core - O-antigen ligase and related enzymes
MLEDGRLDYLQQGWPLIGQYLPWGSGAGSFREVYGAHEPLALLAPNYVLHAHNEPVELLLELGLPGGLLLLAGIALLAGNHWQVWRAARSEAALLPRLAVLGLGCRCCTARWITHCAPWPSAQLVALLLAVTTRTESEATPPRAY